MDKWISVDEIAHHLSVAPITIYRWVDAKRIPSHRIGRQIRFLISEIDAWVKAGKAADGSRREQSDGA